MSSLVLINLEGSSKGRKIESKGQFPKSSWVKSY